jgi:hypothetical protein
MMPMPGGNKLYMKNNGLHATNNTAITLPTSNLKRSFIFQPNYQISYLNNAYSASAINKSKSKLLVPDYF